VYSTVSMALMLVLETLSPTERAVFVLREAFDVSYDEIAAAVDKTPAAVRQIAHRARQHVDARRPREVVSSSETRAVLESFQRAIETGDPAAALTGPAARGDRETVTRHLEALRTLAPDKLPLVVHLARETLRQKERLGGLTQEQRELLADLVASE